MVRTQGTGVWIVLGVVLAILAGPGALPGQAIDREGLAEDITREMGKTLERGKIPSAAVALVEGQEVLWTGAAGYSNIWAGIEAVPETVYLIGSTFKTMSMFALLGIMEEGQFDLDDPVNDYLDEFKIQGDDPGNPVTFRHLLTHTSGLPADFGPHAVWGPTVPPALSDYLRKSLRLKRPPMTETVYSNTAYTLIGYLVEKLSGTRFKRYIQDRIFDPLGMSDTAFEPKPHMEERLSIPYVYDSRSGRHVPAVRTKANVWPAGIVYGTVLDQAKWLIANLNRGAYGEHRLISEATFRQVMTRQHDRFTGPISAGWLNETTGFGLTWWMSEREGDTLFAHSGSVTGYTAFMVGNLDKKTGFAILTNGNRAHKHLFALAVEALDLMEKHRK
jgi:CubicO group peptidase (beta-lactamase class C family)